MGSAGGNARPGGGLQRQNSSGSMTERTFRDPSPNRGPSPRGNANYAPPVPALPKGYSSPVPPVPQKSHRRASSMEPPLRVSSPPPKKTGGRGVSLDRGPGVMTTRRSGQSAQRVTSLGSVAELERTGSKGSVNFSRPMSAQNSPPTSPLSERRPTSLSSGQPSSASPLAVARPTNRELAPGEAKNIQQTLQEAANRPVKKKVVYKGEGSHLTSGVANTGPVGSAMDHNSESQNSPAQVSQIQSTNNGVGAPAPKKKKKKIVSGTNSDDESQRAGTNASYASDSDSTAERATTFNTRAAGLLSKQPSVVREDREAEEREERSGVDVSRAGPGFPMNVNPKSSGKRNPLPATLSQQYTDSQQHSRSSSQPAPMLTTPASRETSGSDASEGRGNGSIRGGRHQSLSPARAAHFSAQPIFETPNGTKHQPPPRSVSPAKSALKHSPSPRALSPFDGMPGSRARDHGHAPSEASDTTSMLSEDGIRSGPRRKKNVRVSFDDDAVVVPGRGVSPPTSSDSPVVMGAQSKDTPNRGWFGLGHGKKQVDSPSASQGQDEDDVMKPTPTLPSFGSIRGRNEREDVGLPDENPSASIEPHHAPTSWAQDTLARINMSSDQALGGILSQDFVTKPTTPSHEPLPPEVTSVEGTGYGSDSDGSVYSTDNKVGAGSGANHNTSEAHAAPYRELASPPLDSQEAHEYDVVQSDEAVPFIAVQPATPAEDTLRGSEWVGMPKDYPMSTESRDMKDENLEIVQHHPTDPTPASIGIAEPEPEGVMVSRESATPVVGEVADALRLQTEHENDSEDTGDSIYSDAAEDLSDLEGDGFGSINAIVESPVMDTFGLAITTPPDSPTGRLPAPVQAKKSKLSTQASNEPEPGADEGWDKAQAYWSGLSESRKKQLERAAAQEAVYEAPIAEEAKPKKKKMVAKKAPRTAGVNQPPLPPWPDKQYIEETARSTSPRMPEMKQSMRAGAATTAEEPHMRKSMRTGGTMKSSMRQGPPPQAMEMRKPQEPRGALQKKYRPVSAVSAVPLVNYNTPSVGGTASYFRTASGGVAPTPATPLMPKSAKKKVGVSANLRRTKSNDSDSSSSFRKLRPASSDGGRYNMKKSMRGPSAERPLSPNAGKPSGFSIRSLSPTGSTARKPFSSGGHGMRSAMRSSMDSSAPSLRPDRTKSPTRSFGLGRGSKAKSSAAPSKSRFSSKFGDSSDDEGGPSTFRSRFGDSSDEGEPSKRPANLTPVRGIPRRADEADSTDLDDSSENEKKLPKQRNMPRTTKVEGSALATGSLRPSGSGRDLSKFNEMGTGLEAKKAAEKDPKRRSFFGLGRKRDDSKVRKVDVESAARRDTPLERSKAERVLGPTSPTSPRSPKLQRRNTPMRLDSNSWPLPPTPGAASDRPNTADGVVRAARPDLGVRSSTAESLGVKADGQNGVVLGKSGKKKRFPTLRKAFGLHD